MTKEETHDNTIAHDNEYILKRNSSINKQKPANSVIININIKTKSLINRTRGLFLIKEWTTLNIL